MEHCQDDVQDFILHTSGLDGPISAGHLNIHVAIVLTQDNRKTEVNTLMVRVCEHIYHKARAHITCMDRRLCRGQGRHVINYLSELDH